MKTHSLSLLRRRLLVLAVVGLFAPLAAPAAPPASPRATAYRVTAIEPYGRPNVEMGVSDKNVKYYLGAPDATLSDGTWVYRDFKPSHKQARKDGCGTVLISFKDGCVSEIRGVNAPALRLIVARLAAADEAAGKVATAQ